MQPENERKYQAIEASIRGQDPIETIERGLDQERTELVRQDIRRIDEILATDDSLTSREKSELYDMGVNLRLDWMYSRHGGRQLDFPRFEGEAKSALAFFGQAVKHAETQYNPIGLWQIEIKMLDLEAFRAQRYLHESQTTFRGTAEAQKIRELANLKMEKTLRASCALMKTMEPYANNEGRLGQDTRGALYEHMVLTYARFRTFADENFDEVFVRSALSREDRPWNGHILPKRSFDIAVESVEGTQLLQTKNYNNDDEYAEPILKVKDTAFGRTRSDLRRYVADFNILIMNSGDPLTKDRTEKAGRELDAVFGAQLDRAAAGA